MGCSEAGTEAIGNENPRDRLMGHGGLFRLSEPVSTRPSAPARSILHRAHPASHLAETYANRRIWSWSGSSRASPSVGMHSEGLWDSPEPDRHSNFDTLGHGYLSEATVRAIHAYQAWNRAAKPDFEIGQERK